MSFGGHFKAGGPIRTCVPFLMVNPALLESVRLLDSLVSAAPSLRGWPSDADHRPLIGLRVTLLG